MAIKLSLPTELTCHILSLLTARDICHCAMTCKAFWNVVRTSVHLQYKLELYAQGFTETATLNSIIVARKMSLLKKLTLLWRSDLHLNTILNEVVVVVTASDGLASPQYMSWGQSVKCGLWWMWTHCGLFIRDCNANTNLSRTWLKLSLLSHWRRRAVRQLTVDPLQDLVVMVSSPDYVNVTNLEQDHLAFWVEFRHTFDAPGSYRVGIVAGPVICGDRIFVYYYWENMGDPTISIQVIDWRKGCAKCLLLDRQDFLQQFHVIDQQTIVAIGSSSFTVYTLQGLDDKLNGSPQLRLTYLLPKSRNLYMSFTAVHASPSFCGAAAGTDLMPGHVPSLESQIMVLGFSGPRTPSFILVVDMAIFLGRALRSETPVEIPWSDWGPQHTWCFPHDQSHRISVFGRKMAYALPQDHTPEVGQRLKALSANGSFYIHIWDFNKRVVARSENIHDPNTPDLLIRKPGIVAPSQSCFDEEITSRYPYIAAVCRTPFSADCLHNLYLEEDWITSTWSRSDAVDIQVVSPAQIEVGSRPTN